MARTGAEGDWRRAEAVVTQAGDTARVVLAGDGDLDTAAGQVCRFLALDVDGRGWPEVSRREPVIASAQARLPGLRPCGLRSPYEAAAWLVLSQRLRVVQAARLRDELISRHGQDGAFPPPHALVRELIMILKNRSPTISITTEDVAALTSRFEIMYQVSEDPGAIQPPPDPVIQR